MVYLSRADETTLDSCLSSCIAGSYVLEALGWHSALESLRRDDYGRKSEKPNRKAKTVPTNIERHVFAEPPLTAYRFKVAA